MEGRFSEGTREISWFMRVLVFGLLLFILAFVLQLTLWKIHLPRRQVKTMLQIFFATLVCGVTALWCAPPSFTLMGLPAPSSPWGYLHICLFFISLTLAYMITYSALEADSPSLVMIMTIYNSEPEGLDRDRFRELMSDETLVMPRIKDVLLDRMVYMDGDRYCLTDKGRLMARLFLFYRSLVNAPEGG